jgi:HAD superfamily hydrolase (TIGR01549 family)
MGVIFDLDETLVNTSPAKKELEEENFKEAEQLIDRFTLYNGMPELLNFLREKNIKMAVVSTSPRAYCEQVLQRLHIDCGCIVGKGETAEKPSPAPMEKALEVLGLTSDDVVSMGDRGKDIVSSNVAGVRSIGCLWGDEGEKLRSSKPDHVIATPLEAIPILREVFNL